MTGLLLPPDASLTPRPDTQTLRPTLSVDKLAALLPTPDVTRTNSRNTGEAGNAAIRGQQAQDVASALNGTGPGTTPSTRETLSFAARTILDLLGRGADSAPLAAAALLTAPPTAASTATLPAALAGLVDHSGLFYESHLAAWINGARTLADVRKDPQATLGTPGQDAGTSDTPDAATARPVALLPAPEARPGPAAGPATATGDMTGSPADVLDRALAMQAASAAAHDDATSTPARTAAFRTTVTLHDPGQTDHAALAQRNLAQGPQTGTGPSATPQQGAQFYEAMARTAEAPLPATGALQQADSAQNSQPASLLTPGPAVHPGAESLVRQQLELLATQQFRWTGEAWPGTHMAWEIVRDSVEDDPAHAAPAAQTWSTRLLLQLPELGMVEARLSLSRSGLFARLVAGEPDVTERIDDARGKLQQRLAANGIELLQFVAGTGTLNAPKGTS